MIKYKYKGDEVVIYAQTQTHVVYSSVNPMQGFSSRSATIKNFFSEARKIVEKKKGVKSVVKSIKPVIPSVKAVPVTDDVLEEDYLNNSVETDENYI